MPVLQTARLVLRDFTLADAAFILALLNEPAFQQFVGDKGVRDLAGAEKYLRDGPLASYARHGFGLWCVTRKDGTPIGSCGLLQRDFLEHPDLGYALLAAHTGRGYAHEAAVAVLQHARLALKLGPLLAITAPENPASIRLLGKLGFAFDRMDNFPGFAGPSRVFRAPSGAVAGP